MKDAKVYILESTSKNLKKEIGRYADIMEISNPQKICENVWTTGVLGSKTKEQSLVLYTKNGNIILTGCAHPGLKLIIKRSTQFGPIYGIVGGFHNSQIDNLGNNTINYPMSLYSNWANKKNIQPKQRMLCRMPI